MTTFIYEYPDGQEPTYWVHEEKWVVTYPKGDKRYFRRNGFWHPFPQGGAPVMREHENFIYDYPTAPTPRFYFREVAQ